jgi:hypothetical protein
MLGLSPREDVSNREMTFVGSDESATIQAAFTESWDVCQIQELQARGSRGALFGEHRLKVRIGAYLVPSASSSAVPASPQQTAVILSCLHGDHGSPFSQDGVAWIGRPYVGWLRLHYPVEPRHDGLTAM